MASRDNIFSRKHSESSTPKEQPVEALPVGLAVWRAGAGAAQAPQPCPIPTAPRGSC